MSPPDPAAPSTREMSEDQEAAVSDRGNVHLRRLDNREIIYTIPVSGLVSERDYERFMRGLIRKTDQDRFFVDDSEIAFAGARRAATPPGTTLEGDQRE